MANRIKKRNKEVKNFDDVRVLTEAQLWELIDKKEFAWHKHLNKTPLHLLEDREVLEKLVDPSLSVYPPDLLKRLSDKCKSNVKNKDIFTRLLTNNHASFAMREMSTKRRGDLDFVLNILQIYKDRKESSGHIYDDLTPRLKNLKKVALLAIQTGSDPRYLPDKLKTDIDIFKAYIRYQNHRAKKYKRKPHYYHLDEFKFKKMALDLNYIAKVLQKDPDQYQHICLHHSNLKQFAWLALKHDVRLYQHLSARLKKHRAIINYVGTRDPRLLVDNLTSQTLLKINYSKLDLGKKAREYIFATCKKTLQEKNADLLEIAACKANIFKFPQGDSNIEHCNNWHFSKEAVLKAISKFPTSNYFFHSNKHDAIKLLSNISFDLKYDFDILCQLAIKGGFSPASTQYIPLQLSPKLTRQINKYLFVRGRYSQISLPSKGRLRDYMVRRICSYQTLGLDSGLGTIVRSLTVDEKVKNLKKYPQIFKEFYSDDIIHITKSLDKNERENLINDKDLLRYQSIWCLHKLIDKSNKKNLKLGINWLSYWPCKESTKLIDINYLFKHESFLACLKNLKEITIHAGDLESLPVALRNNKLFVKKALNYKLNLFREIGKSLQTDPEITDWVFAIKPTQAKFLSEAQFKKLDTTNLHPFVRNIIYKKYLAKYAANDVLENAIMKQKLLQINPAEDEAA